MKLRCTESKCRRAHSHFSEFRCANISDIQGVFCITLIFNASQQSPSVFLINTFLLEIANGRVTASEQEKDL